MKNIKRKKIVFIIVVFLIMAGYYYSVSDKHNDASEYAIEEKMEITQDVVDEIDDPNPEIIPEESSQKETNKNTSDSDMIESEKESDQKPAEQIEIKSILFEVPFMPQAPFGNWSDPRKQDGCEEAAAIMAMAWVKGETLDAKSADEEINAIAAYEEKTYGTFHDTSAFDTAERIFKDYFKYQNVKVRYRIKKEDIVKELAAGNLVIVPTNGQLLDNPNYTPPGPVTHNLVIIGYDVKTKEFVTNDPGTRKGKGYRYNEDVLENAIIDYLTGSHEKIEEEKTAMIVVRK